MRPRCVGEGANDLILVVDAKNLKRRGAFRAGQQVNVVALLDEPVEGLVSVV